MRLLVDSDALIHMRKLSLWELLLGQCAASLHMTGFAARHECVSLQQEVQAWAQLGKLSVHDVMTGTNAYASFRQFKAQVDKGEAEAIAWALGEAESPAFVSCDGKARRFAAAHGLTAWHLGDLARWFVNGAAIESAIVEPKLIRWDDASQQVGRPPNWRGLATWLAG